MKTTVQVCLYLALFAVIALAESPFVGIWSGKMGDLPAVTITVEVQGAKLAGKAEFYLLTRTSETEPRHVDGSASSPLINLKEQGKF